MGSPSGANSDREAFEALVEQYIDRLYRAALRLTGSPQDAEDALQD
ncbi:MAG TPA: sigma factor, partial [Chloroflexota bacterium]